MNPTSPPTPHRWTILKIVLAIVILVGIGVALSLQRSHRPNVLLVTLDSTRADRIGIYGYQHGQTEKFDEFGKGSVLFEHAYAPVPLTLPSHTSILTGLYPPEHGMRVDGTGRLSREILLLPEIVKQSGYRTAAFVSTFALSSKFGLERGFDVYNDDLSQSQVAERSSERRRHGANVVDSAIRWLRKSTWQPFFCWVHLSDARSHYDARPDLFGDKFQDQPYDAGIAVEAQEFHRLLNYLKSQGLNDNTLIIVVGDHGEGLNDHHEEQHGQQLYQSTLRVPLLIGGVKDFKAGHRVDEPVSLVDLMPTILEFLKVPAPKQISGRSLLSAIRGGELTSQPCYAETVAPLLENRWSPQCAAISGKWKYIHSAKQELYDLQADSREATNLAGSDADDLQEMESILKELHQRFHVAPLMNVPLSHQDKEYLAAFDDGTENKTGAQTLPDVKEMLPFASKLKTARQRLVEGDFESAINNAKEILDATKSYPMANLLLGEAYFKQGKLNEAEVCYQAVLALQPDSGPAHSHLATLYSKREKWDMAAEELREVIKIDPDDSQAHYDLAVLLSRQFKPADAIAEFREAVRSDAGFVQAQFLLGIVHAKIEQFKEAAGCFEQAVKYNPKFTAAYVNLAESRNQLGQHDQALQASKKAVELEPDSFDAHLHLGVSYMGLNRTREAISELELAQKINPVDPRASVYLRQLR